MPKGQAPAYPQKSPYGNASHPYNEAPATGEVAKNHNPEHGRALAEQALVLEEGRRNASAGGKASSPSGRGKRII